MDRLFYFISPFCLLRPTTNRIFDVRFCDLLAGTGNEVTMIHPYYFMKENIDEKDIASSYGVSHPLKFRMLKTPLNNDSKRWWQLTVLLFSFFKLSLKLIFQNRKNPSTIFIITRDNKTALPMMLLKKMSGGFSKIKMINTVHEVKEGKLNTWMYRNYDGLLVTTLSAKVKLVQGLSIPELKIDRFISPVSQINYSISKAEARKKINYLDTKPLVVYTGKLGYGIQELEYILGAAADLPHYNFILTGGKSEVVKHFKQVCGDRGILNMYFPGFINDSMFISNYQLSADALISYYSGKDHVVEYNFPQKLVEYMYTHNPIVTPDFPATHDVINASNAIIVKPDDTGSLVAGIKKAIEQKEFSKALADQAYKDIQQFSFENKAGGLMNFFGRL